KSIVITFVLLALIGGVVQFGVPVNYNMTDYLPASAPSTVAIDVMSEEFDEDVANTRVMVKNVSVQEAIDFKEEIEAMDGVSVVMWLDDVIDIRTPIEMADIDTVETYYQDGHALFSFQVDEGKEIEATDAIYEIIGEENALSGDALEI